MKLGNILLVIFASLLTFIGLLVNNIYTKFIKDNIVIISTLYVFFTVLSLRVLYFVAKPLINGTVNAITKFCSQFTTNLVSININVGGDVAYPYLIALGIIVLGIIACVVIVNKAIKDISN